jgi:transcriptional regulator GlxA family with amidase domain
MIVVPVYEGVDVLDVTGPFEMFRWAGLEVSIVAQKPGAIMCNGGLVLQAQIPFAETPPAEVLWTPGGDPAALNGQMNNPVFLNFLVKQSKDARFVASVCEGALLLAAAGLLDGYSATTHWAFIPCLLKRFPNVNVVDGHPRFHLDRNRLTGGGISSGLDEALELIRLLQGEPAANMCSRLRSITPILQ